MTNEVVVRDDASASWCPFEPMDYDEMVLTALGERAAAPADGRAEPRRPRGPAGRLVSRLAGLAAPRLPGGWSRRCRATTASPTRRSTAGGGWSPGVAVAGAGLLGISLSTKPGSPPFYGLTLGVAGTWLAGGLASGPLHLGWMFAPATTAAPPGGHAGAHRGGRVRRLLRRGAGRPPGPGAGPRRSPRSCATPTRARRPLVLTTTLANGVAEEVFFRGALYAAIGVDRPVVDVDRGVRPGHRRRPATRRWCSPRLVMGTLFGLQRRATGGIQAPMLTHLTWSALMLRYLPPLFADRPDVDG